MLALSSLTKVTGGFSGPWPERNEAGGEAPGTGPPQALELPLACPSTPGYPVQMGRWEKRGSSWREGVREGCVCTWKHGLGRPLGFPELQRFPHKTEILLCTGGYLFFLRLCQEGCVRCPGLYASLLSAPRSCALRRLCLRPLYYKGCVHWLGLSAAPLSVPLSAPVCLGSQSMAC